MSRKDEIIEAFKNHRWQMSLGHMLCYPWGYKATSRFSELRDLGYTIECVKGKKPSENVYKITPPDDSGQMRFI